MKVLKSHSIALMLGIAFTVLAQSEQVLAEATVGPTLNTINGSGTVSPDELKANEEILHQQDVSNQHHEHLNIDGEEVDLVGGDILVEAHNIERRAVMIRNKDNLWHSRVIPYEFDSSIVQSDKKSNIEKVIKYFNDEPTLCLRFVLRTNEPAYLHFISGSGCYSYIGRIKRKQTVSIGTGCNSFGIIAHEIMHALGFWHQQSRPDRDNYVQIMYQNIPNGKANNFDKKMIKDAEVFSKYDYSSVMHYGEKSFSTNGLATIKTIPTSIAIGQRIRPSETDLRAIAYLYSCTTPDGEWSAWSPCQYCDQKRQRVCFACNGTSAVETHDHKCPCNVNPSWSNWEPWSQCSVSCGGGRKYRNKICNNGLIGSGSCLGSDMETMTCNTNSCGGNTSSWTAWSQWSACSANCGSGSQTRTRSCVGTTTCSGEAQQTRVCSVGPCITRIIVWASWSSWSNCNATCGVGFRRRTRTCNGGLQCVGSSSEVSQCASTVGPCGPSWSDWSSWSICNASCGSGNQSRTRTCSIGSNGLLCNGSSIEVSGCFAGPCASWADWALWSACSVSVGEGFRTRTRNCVRNVTATPFCYGPASQVEKCSGNEVSVLQQCNFTNGFCQWCNIYSSKWLKESVPDVHTNTDIRSGYSYIVARLPPSRRRRRVKKFGLMSSVFENSKFNYFCFKFQYKSMRGSYSDLRLIGHFKRRNGRRWFKRILKRLRLSTSQRWKTVRKTIRSYRQFKLMLEATLGGRKGEVKARQFSLVKGRC